jgi:hypothetical protein
LLFVVLVLSTLAVAQHLRRPLARHTTFDLTLGKDFGERVSGSLNLLHVANRRVILDNSQTFGGFHWNNPREIFVEPGYRFGCGHR